MILLRRNSFSTLELTLKSWESLVSLTLPSNSAWLTVQLRVWVWGEDPSRPRSILGRGRGGEWLSRVPTPPCPLPVSGTATLGLLFLSFGTFHNLRWWWICNSVWRCSPLYNFTQSGFLLFNVKPDHYFDLWNINSQLPVKIWFFN